MRFVSEPLLVFIHLPKTGGTTLESLLRHHYGESLGAVKTRSARDAEDFRRRLAATLAAGPVRAIKGHFTFGLSDLLPADARYVTILREPIERTLSHYHQNATHGGKWHSRLLPPAPEGMSLVEWIERGYIPDNLQTRMLCGLVSPWDELPAGALEQAKRNLSGFAYVGTTERFEEFMALLNVELGWPTVAYKLGRVGKGRLRAEDLSRDELRLVEEANQLDRELHAYAAELTAEALERASGPDLERELEVLTHALARARAREVAPLRSLPLDTRIELALKERDLGRARAVARKHAREEARLREKVASLKGRVASPEAPYY